MSTSPPPSGRRARASQILRVRKIWAIPVVIATVFVALMSAIYFGSVVNPTGHLHNLPVIVVNEDTGGVANGQKVNVGDSVVSGIEGSSAVTSRLKLENTTLSAAKAIMNRGGAYPTLVIPATLTRWYLSRQALPGWGGCPRGVSTCRRTSVSVPSECRSRPV